MSAARWADVKKGMSVELAGREWTVVTYKAKGKKAKVTVERNGRTATSVVALKEKVTIARGKPKRPPLQDVTGAQNRWATDRELKKALAVLPTGDSTKTKPPTKAKGGAWDQVADKVEKTMTKVLSARLVGETKNEAAGYYVPPVDTSTVAAHLAVFHGGIPEACNDEEGRMLDVHNRQHAAALEGAPLAVNHWHTEKRP